MQAQCSEETWMLPSCSLFSSMKREWLLLIFTPVRLFYFILLAIFCPRMHRGLCWHASVNSSQHWHTTHPGQNFLDSLSRCDSHTKCSGRQHHALSQRWEAVAFGSSVVFPLNAITTWCAVKYRPSSWKARKSFAPWDAECPRNTAAVRWTFPFLFPYSWQVYSGSSSPWSFIVNGCFFSSPIRCVNCAGLSLLTTVASFTCSRLGCLSFPLAFLLFAATLFILKKSFGAKS